MISRFFGVLDSGGALAREDSPPSRLLEIPRCEMGVRRRLVRTREVPIFEALSTASTYGATDAQTTQTPRVQLAVYTVVSCAEPIHPLSPSGRLKVR